MMVIFLPCLSVDDPLWHSKVEDHDTLALTISSQGSPTTCLVTIRQFEWQKVVDT